LKYAKWENYTTVGGIQNGKRISYYEMFDQTIDGLCKEIGFLPESISMLLSAMSRYSNKNAMKKIKSVLSKYDKLGGKTK